MGRECSRGREGCAGFFVIDADEVLIAAATRRGADLKYGSGGTLVSPDLDRRQYDNRLDENSGVAGPPVPLMIIHRGLGGSPKAAACSARSTRGGRLVYGRQSHPVQLDQDSGGRLSRVDAMQVQPAALAA